MIFKAIMRYFSFVFHIVLALFLIVVAAVAITSGVGSLRLGMLPWSGEALPYILLFAPMVGLLTVLLAMKGVLRILFLIWSFVVFAVLVKGYIFSRYHFAPNEFRTALYLIVGSLVALAGAWFQLRTDARPKKY